MRRVLPILASCLLVAGCAGGSLSAGPPQTTRSTPTAGPDQAATAALAAYTGGTGSDSTSGDEVFHFLAEDRSIVDRAPWSACLGNACWDGAPTLGGPIDSVGSPDALYFAFDYPGWRFRDVSLHPVDDSSTQRVVTVSATQVSDRVFRIDPAGVLPDQWRVDVFGRGPEGDAVASVLWESPSA